MGTHKHYRHVRRKQADADYRTGQVKKRYRVTTYATDESGKIDRSNVHRNEYSLTIRGLISFLRETKETVLDIAEIRPEDTGSEDSSGTRRRA